MPSLCSTYAVVPLWSVICEETETYAPERGALPAPTVELDAFELHRRITGFQRLTDRCRYEFLRLLAVLDDEARYLELGYSSAKQYLVRELNLGRANALELIRVARRLRDLPCLASALADGEIRWSILKTVSRVATSASDAEWLDFAKQHTPEQIEHEVKRAISERRDKPADASDFGLSNVMARVSFELTLEEKERFSTAMARVADGMGEGAPTDLASVITFISQRILEGQPLGGDATVYSVDTPGDTAAPALTVVYHQYGDAISTVDTADGPVRVDPDVVDRIADVAQTVTLTAADLAASEPLPDGAIDRPNTSTLARKVRMRDGERCTNPGCGNRKQLQAHHIVFRANGGRSAMTNEVAVCRRCHTLLHAGLVAIERDEAGQLSWVPRVRTAGTASPIEFLPELARLMEQPASAAPTSSAAAAVDFDALVDGLTSLGYAKRVAEQRIDAAHAALRARARKTEEADNAIDEAALLSEALRIGAPFVAAGP